MKKSAIILVLFLTIFSITLAFAEEDQTTSEEDTTTIDKDTTTIDQAFKCLEEKASDCSGLTTQEIALTIMATPDNIFEDCVEELQSRQSEDNWGNIKDTSLAIIALKHAGQDTTASEEWLLAQNQTPSNLIWYIQQDSNEAVQCNIGYDATDYTVNINTDKKIDKNAGACLTRSQSAFWLQIASTCYDKKFQIECDKDFIANLIYRNKNSPTIYVLEGFAPAPAFGSVELKVISRCFGDNACDYESTAWATLALLETGHNIDDFIPYMIAMSETSEKYLPSAFIYALTNYEDYANSLIAQQKRGNYWEAPSSAYDKYYDTGLALLSLVNSNAEQIVKAKDWLFFSQESSGCWGNSLVDTAMVLWALDKRPGRSVTTQGPIATRCAEAGFFCIPSDECVVGTDVSDNYFCGIGNTVCCTDENLKECSEYAGSICASDKVCVGTLKKATDTESCCTGTCEEKSTVNECEENYYTCMDTCSDFQESVSTYACDGAQVCCRTKTTDKKEGSSWWIWMIVVLMLAALGAVGYFYREQLKLYWFQLKTKFKKDEGGQKPPSSPRPPFPPRPGLPPKPGFPPIRRPMPQVQRPPQSQEPQKKSYSRRDKAISETFKKLQDISK